MSDVVTVETSRQKEHTTHAYTDSVFVYDTNQQQAQRPNMTMQKLVRAIGALVNRNAAVRGDVEPVSATPSDEGRMIFSLSICLVVSIIVVAIADEIERRSAACGDGMGSVDAGASPTPMSSIGDSHAAKSHRSMISSADASNNNGEQPPQTIMTNNQLDDLVDDIVKTSTKMKEEASKSTRQFDEIMKYDQFLKLIKS